MNISRIVELLNSDTSRNITNNTDISSNQNNLYPFNINLRIIQLDNEVISSNTETETEAETQPYNIIENINNRSYDDSTFINLLENTLSSYYNNNIVNYGYDYNYDYDLDLDLVLNQENSFLNNFINNTMNREKNKYKRVIDDSELDKLKKIKYNKDIISTSDSINYYTKCPIYHTEFNEGDDIVVLPCKHIYLSEGIEKWLLEESNTCPVCRYEFKYKEIINKKYIQEQEEEQRQEQEEEQRQEQEQDQRQEEFILENIQNYDEDEDEHEDEY